jgi:hypothetical protein
MAFKKLREIRDRFEKLWINGGFIFGYENEINEKHDNDYPLLVVLPPTSELPATEGTSKEDYTFECLIVKPYYQNQTGSLDIVFSLLEQEALSWLQRVLDSYPNRDVILSPESIAVEREKELYNDKLIQVRLTFTLNAFSHNFSFVDESFITALTPRVWLRSDMGVKTSYSGGNEVVSRWIDQSGFGNHFEQTTLTKMPSYEYKMSDNSYPFINFDGTDDFMECVDSSINFDDKGLLQDHTIFLVTRDKSEQSSFILSLNAGLANIPQMFIEARFAGSYMIPRANYVDDDFDAVQNDVNKSLFSVSDVFAFHFHNKTSKVYSNGQMLNSVTNSQFDDFGAYGVGNKMTIGSDNGGAARFFKGDIQEIIIFNSSLSEENIVKISDYLQHKYDIA